MRKKLVILSVSLLLAGAAVFVLFPHESEPVYQGKPLREWLAVYTQGVTVNSKGIITVGDKVASDAAREQANEAIIKMGTNALPSLLRLLEDQDFLLKFRWIGPFLEKQHFIKPAQPAWLSYSQADQAFKALGPSGSNAVPALVRLYQRRISIDSQTFVLDALAYIGHCAAPAGMPVFLDGMTNSNFSIRTEALFDIGMIHAEPDVFVPILVKALNDQQPNVRRSATRSLGAYGIEAKTAVPTLIPLLHDPNTDVRSAANKALSEIDSEAVGHQGLK